MAHRKRTAGSDNSTGSTWHIRPLHYQESVKDPNAMRPIAKGGLIGALSLPTLAYLGHQYAKLKNPSGNLMFGGKGMSPSVTTALLASLGAATGSSIGALVESDQIPIGVKAEQIQNSVLPSQKLATLRCTKSSAYKEANPMSLEDRVLLKMSSCFSDGDIQQAIAISQQELAGHKLASEEATVLALRDSVMQKLAQSFTNEELQGVIQQAEAEEQGNMSQNSISPELAMQLANTLGAEKVSYLVQQVQNEKEAEKIASYHYELGQIMAQGMMDKLADSRMFAPLRGDPNYSVVGRAISDASHSAAEAGKATAKALMDKAEQAKALALAHPYASAALATGALAAGGYGAYRATRQDEEQKVATITEAASDLYGRLTTGIPKIPGAISGAFNSALEATNSIPDVAGAMKDVALGRYKVVPGTMLEGAKALAHGAVLPAAAIAAGYGGYRALKKKDEEKVSSHSDIYQALAVLESAGINTKKLL